MVLAEWRGCVFAAVPLFFACLSFSSLGSRSCCRGDGSVTLSSIAWPFEGSRTGTVSPGLMNPSRNIHPSSSWSLCNQFSSWLSVELLNASVMVAEAQAGLNQVLVGQIPPLPPKISIFLDCLYLSLFSLTTLVSCFLWKGMFFWLLFGFSTVFDPQHIFTLDKKMLHHQPKIS